MIKVVNPLLVSALKNLRSVFMGHVSYRLVIIYVCVLCGFSNAYAETEKDENISSEEAQKLGRENFVYPGGVTKNTPEKAPRIAVKQFIINGIVERPEKDISREKILKLVEEIRSSQTDGFSILEFRKVTDALTQYYRQRGFFLARAFIPEQDVRNDTVEINIIEGILDKVEFQGNKLYSDKQLAEFFKPQLGKPVLSDTMESSLLLIDDYPGLKVSGLFQPGAEAGKTTLIIKALSEKKFENYLTFDNAGTESTGLYRTMLRIHGNNLTHSADSLNLNILQTVNPTNSTYYSFYYERPFLNSSYSTGFGYSNNAFVVGQFLAELDVEGTSDITNVFLRKNIQRSRDRNYGFSLDLSKKNAESTQSIQSIGEDILTVLSASVDFTYSDKVLGGYNQGIFQYSQGLPDFLGSMDENGNGNSSRQGSSGNRAGGDFDKLLVNYVRVQPIKSITSSDTFKNQSLMLRLTMQYSKDLLTSLEQFPLGGPNSVRAYPSSEKLVDSTTFFSAEWIARAVDTEGANWLQGLQLSVFLDYAKGEVNEPLTNDAASVNLSGVGAAVQISPHNAEFEARLDISRALSSEEPSNEQSLQYFFKLGYHF